MRSETTRETFALMTRAKSLSIIGFIRRSGSGSSHNFFSRPGETTVLNFQKNKNGKIPRYQAEQLIAMVDKYDSED